MRALWKRSFRVFIAIALVAGTISPVATNRQAMAAQITERTLTLEAGAEDGGSLPGGEVNHAFTFTVPTEDSIGSIAFEYCTIASGTCTLPTGVVTTTATLGNETGATGFSIDNTANGRPVLTRSASLIGANTELSYTLNTVTNPTTANETFFVRISTYTSTDGTGTPVDEGTVAASTANPIQLEGTMPESLIFCTGGAISATNGVPDCTSATSGAVSFDQLFSPTDTATATSQMAASTNALSGYNITVTGATLTSGANTIDPMDDAGASVASSVGTSQFGMNLKLNTITDVNDDPLGLEVTPGFDAPNDYTGDAAVNYDTADSFKFASGDSVAQSTGPSNAQIFTSSYIVNVPGSQPAGSYTTTLTYICTPTF